MLQKLYISPYFVRIMLWRWECLQDTGDFQFVHYIFPKKNSRLSTTNTLKFYNWCRSALYVSVWAFSLSTNICVCQSYLFRLCKSNKKWAWDIAYLNVLKTTTYATLLKPEENCWLQFHLFPKMNCLPSDLGRIMLVCPNAVSLYSQHE